MRPTIAAAAVLAVMTLAQALPAYAGERYTSDTEQFEVTVPDGWIHAPGKNGARVDLTMLSPRFPTTLGLCIMVSEQVADTRDMTQKQINEMMASEINDAFWQTGIKQDPYAKDVTVESRNETRGDRRVARATAHFTFKLKDKDVPTRAELSLHAVPGRMMLAQCGASKAEFAAEDIDIKTVMDTFNPTGPGLVAGVLPSPGVQRMAAPRRMSASVAPALRDAVRAMLERVGEAR